MERQQAYEWLTEYTKNPNLIRHALHVEGVMKHFAKKYDPENIEKWGVVGLIHDIDYELYPTEHCIKAKEILESKGCPDDYIRSVQSHGWEICTDVQPQHRMEKILYATDELTGLINATALMKPSKDVNDVDLKSVKKKWKQKNFAAGVNRQIIEKGAELLDLPLDEIIEETITAMKEISQ